MPDTSLQQGVRKFDPAPKFSIDYDLYIPPGSSPSPFPFFLLIHGFAGNKSHLSGHAEALSKRGCVVMNVNMSSLFAPSTTLAQERNISQAVSHVHWARTLKNSEGTGPLIDPSLVFLCGHSAGGAVALEASVALRKEGVNVKGLCLLDGVPWPRTEKVASTELFGGGLGGPVHVLSLRSVPGAWNLQGRIKDTLDAAWVEKKSSSEGQQQQQQSYTDVFISESGHGDPINPQKRGFIVSLLGLLGPPRCANIYADLLSAFGAARGEAGQAPLVELVDKLVNEKCVVLTKYH